MNKPPFPGAVFLGVGYGRIVYARNDRFVVKIPLNERGRSSNWHEAAVSKRFGKNADPDGISYALCRTMPNGWLVMERVRINAVQLPSWASMIDCQQVGITRGGRIVAYDYGFLPWLQRTIGRLTTGPAELAACAVATVAPPA